MNKGNDTKVYISRTKILKNMDFSEVGLKNS